MTLSIAGLAVWLTLLLLGAGLGGALIVGFFASLPFGATAFASLSGLGGSSPLIYTLFALCLIAAASFRRQLLNRLSLILAQDRTPWLVLALAAYAAAGAYILPRLFAGQANALVPVGGVVTLLPLGPVAGNITQTAYFLLGALTFFAFAVLLLNRDALGQVGRGLIAFALVHALLGWIDLGGKFTGAGDLLAPIRTASYALLSEVEVAGFWRVVGGCSEASSFAGFALAGLAFSYTYWRHSASRIALAALLALLPLVMLSTSSTAYVGGALLVIGGFCSVIGAAAQNRLKTPDVALIMGLLTAAAVIMGILLYDPDLLTPYVDLFRTMVLEKANSSSGLERAQWNQHGLQAVVDTYGLGLGMGSSRASSWIVATLSQLGVMGSVLMLLLVAKLAWGMGRLRPLAGEEPLFALCAGARAAGLGLLAAAAVAGGSADPGILFFACLATTMACRRHVLLARRMSRILKPPPIAAAPATAARRVA
jgi:hypothetical protein